LAGASASTTIRFDAASHQPLVDPGIGSNETVYPSDSANACSGVRRWACESRERLAWRFQRRGVRAR
jgi:hypothetical protein